MLHQQSINTGGIFFHQKWPQSALITACFGKETVMPLITYLFRDTDLHSVLEAQRKALLAEIERRPADALQNNTGPRSSRRRSTARPWAWRTEPGTWWRLSAPRASPPSSSDGGKDYSRGWMFIGACVVLGILAASFIRTRETPVSDSVEASRA
jgi:hypothetical protein